MMKNTNTNSQYKQAALITQNSSLWTKTKSSVSSYFTDIEKTELEIQKHIDKYPEEGMSENMRSLKGETITLKSMSKGAQFSASLS